MPKLNTAANLCARVDAEELYSDLLVSSEKEKLIGKVKVGKRARELFHLIDESAEDGYALARLLVPCRESVKKPLIERSREMLDYALKLGGRLGKMCCGYESAVLLPTGIVGQIGRK